MGRPFLVYARESSGYTSLAPSRQEVTFALGQVPSRMAARGMAGAWSGPSPRFTRWETPAGAWTHVAWPFVLTGSVIPEGFAQALSDVTRELLVANASHDPPLVPSTWAVTVSPLNEIEHGEEAWWTSGRAASEASWVDHWPPLANQVIPGAEAPIEDNHTGPNSLHRPPPVSNPLSWVLALAGVTVAGIALVQFGPALASWAPTKSKPAKTENPRRRR